MIKALEGDGAAARSAIADALGVTPKTYKHYEEKHGAPAPDYYVGQTPFIVKSRVRDWLQSRPKCFQPAVNQRRTETAP